MALKEIRFTFTAGSEWKFAAQINHPESAITKAAIRTFPLLVRECLYDHSGRQSPEFPLIYRPGSQAVFSHYEDQL